MSSFPPIRELVPQQGAMVLLDEVVAASAHSLTARLKVQPGALFFEPGRGVAAHVAIEWMAQACAAFVGLAAVREGQAVRLGLLLGTRDFQASTDWFLADQELEITVEQSFRDQEMAVFDCQVRYAGDVETSQARAQLTVYQPANIDVLLQRQHEGWGA